MNTVDKHPHNTHGGNLDTSGNLGTGGNLGAGGPTGNYHHNGHYNNQGDYEQPGFPNSYRRIANPAPLGLLSFASTTLILSFYNVRARGVNIPNLIIGMALAVGGLVQLLAGMWEFACGNTLGATAFSLYGGFYLSLALIYIPGTGILSAYSGAGSDELNDALGFYFLAWFILTFILFIGSHRSSVGLTSLFFFLTLTFLFLMIGEFMARVTLIKVGGGFGIVTAAIAYYCGAANLWSKDHSYVQLPLMGLGRRTNRTV